MSADPEAVVSATIFAMSDAKRPAPLVDQDCDLRGLDWMPTHGHRLYSSKFYKLALKNPRGGIAAGRLWWMAWQQCPAGSLPNDEETLARFADFGRDMRGWNRAREVALHGFVLCSDGRLYHPLLCDLAKTAWEGRKKAAEKKRKQRNKDAAAAAQRPAGDQAAAERLPSGCRAAENGEFKALKNKDIAFSVPGDVPEERRGEESKKETEPTDVGSGAAGNGATNAPPAITTRKGEVVDLSDPVAAARHKLWTEGRDILAKIDTAMEMNVLRDLLARLVAAHSGTYGKSFGLPRAMQALRDMECEWLAGNIQAGAKLYVEKIIHRVKGTAKADPRPDPRGELPATRRHRQQRAAQAAVDGDGGLPPPRGAVIDGEAEDALAWANEKT